MSQNQKPLDPSLQTLFRVADRALNGREIHQPRIEEIGVIRTIGNGVARIGGLPEVQSEDLLYLADEVPALAFNLEEDEAGLILLGDDSRLSAGDPVGRTGRVMDTPVGEALLGRVIDPLGRPLDGRGEIRTTQRRPLERDAPPIMDRAPVTVPLQTGLKVVDALIPMGRGQHELILGDRQTGKTALALDTIINQRDSGVIVSGFEAPSKAGR